MGQPYVGEIRMFGGNFAPAGWMLCWGQLLPISEYEVLFNLIGTTYGGDGQETFNLPNLQGRVPIHMGTGGGATYVIGQAAGVESVTLTTNQMPIHTHAAVADNHPGTAASPANTTWAASNNYYQFAPAPGAANMNAGAIGNAGGSQPHDNMLPYLVINFIIAFEGIYPTQN